MKATLVSTAPKSAFKEIQEYIPDLAKHRGLITPTSAWKTITTVTRYTITVKFCSGEMLFEPNPKST